MARHPKLTLESGEEIMELLSVSYSISAASDARGIPTMTRCCGGLRITRRSDDCKAIANWAKSAEKGNRLGGSIELLGTNGETLKKFEWTGGFVSDYRITCQEGSDGPREEFTIQAPVFKVGGKEVKWNWGNH